MSEDIKDTLTIQYEVVTKPVANDSDVKTIIDKSKSLLHWKPLMNFLEQY